MLPVGKIPFLKRETEWPRAGKQLMGAGTTSDFSASPLNFLVGSW